ncbi:MAG: hypothetical protein JWR26_2325 [Pedosphaera sp.]|nr:hypothetical protein [Pedosphaera sp.]
MPDTGSDPPVQWPLAPRPVIVSGRIKAYYGHIRVAAAPAGLVVLYPAVLQAAAVPPFTLPVLLIVPPSVPRRGRPVPSRSVEPSPEMQGLGPRLARTTESHADM